MNHSGLRWILPLLIALIGWLPSSAAQAQAPTQDEAQDEAEAVQRDMLVLVRALAYDRSLAERFGTELKVGVLHMGNAPTGEAEVAMAVLTALAEIKIGGLALEAAPVRWTSAAALTEELQRESIDVIFVPRELDKAAAAVPELARTLGRTSITRHRPWVEAGIALGVEQFEDKPRVVVNLEAAKAEGAAFGADLLQLADVVK